MSKRIKAVLVLSAFILTTIGAFPALAAEKVDVRKMAEDLAQFLLSTRRLLAQNVDIINTHGAKVGEPLPKNAPSSLKEFIPAYMGRETGGAFLKNPGTR